MTLAEFLLARIAEDLVVADGEDDEPHYHPVLDSIRSSGVDRRACTCSPNRRMVAECEAKRRIVQEHEHTDRCVYYGPKKQRPDPFLGCYTCHDDDGATAPRGWCQTLRLLALPYVDHPDYREEWRP